MQKRNYIMFILMIILAIIEAVSGFVLWLALPHSGEGFRGGRAPLTSATEFISLERHDWLNLHDWIGIALLAVVVIHIILHHKWIAYMTRKLLRKERVG